MTPLRRLALLLGPVPIVLVCLALALLAGGERDLAYHVTNEVQVAPRDAPSPAATAPRTDLAPDRELDRACRERLEVTLRRLAPGCEGLVRPPLVIAGDLPRDELAAWYTGTIGPACRAMRRAYFDAAPDEPVVVLLFSGEESYNRHARRLFGDQGISVFGYYKPHYRTLLLNIDTGGGTLVHELTHALIAFDFPGVPDWFNEGLASLHEQSRIRPDETGIDGLDNWRLPLLKRALAEGRLRRLSELIESADFRSGDEGLNYAHARYFCLYLQHRGLLADFYRRFRAGHPTDPHGRRTLAALIAPQTLPHLDTRFRAWLTHRPAD